MRSPRPGILLGLCWVWVAAMGAEDQWVCVPGEAGRWLCGHDEQALEAIPLEAPKASTDPADIPRNSPYSKPRMPWQPSSNDIAQRQPTPGAGPRQPEPLPLDPSLLTVVADDFVLRLVSVSSEQDVHEFVDDFEIDPDQVRYTRVSEDGNERYLILFGAYPNEQRARFAISVLPASMRAIQPKPAAISSFENPLEDLLETPVARIPTLAASEMPSDSDPATQDQAAGPDPIVATAEQPATELASDPLDPPPGDVVEESSPQVQAPVLARIETPGDLDAATEDQAPAAESIVAIDAQPTKEFPTEQFDSRADDTNEDSSPPEQAPEVADTQVLVLAESEPVPDPPVAAPEKVNDSPAVMPRPAKQKVDIPTPAARKASFGSIDPSYFTLQLSSQKSEESAARFIARHDLDRNRLHLVLIDEGAGARWLVLYSQFPNLAAVEASRYLIPSGIRSPWARRVAPLQQNMIRSR